MGWHEYALEFRFSKRPCYPCSNSTVPSSISSTPLSGSFQFHRAQRTMLCLFYCLLFYLTWLLVLSVSMQMIPDAVSFLWGSHRHVQWVHINPNSKPIVERDTMLTLLIWSWHITHMCTVITLCSQRHTIKAAIIIRQFRWLSRIASVPSCHSRWKRISFPRTGGDSAVFSVPAFDKLVANYTPDCFYITINEDLFSWEMPSWWAYSLS